MHSCTFFGHHDTTDEIIPTLRAAIIDLICNKNVDYFFVGNHGRFDFFVYQTLCQLKERFPHIHYTVVLAYMPKKQNECYFASHETILPDGLENTPPRYAIDKRNTWMIEQSAYVVTYVKYTGGAKKYKERAEKKKRIIIELAPPTT